MLIGPGATKGKQVAVCAQLWCLVVSLTVCSGCGRKSAPAITESDGTGVAGGCRMPGLATLDEVCCMLQDYDGLRKGCRLKVSSFGVLGLQADHSLTIMLRADWQVTSSQLGASAGTSKSGRYMQVREC